jgi:predicted CXXCH cytochrome family protein
MVGILAAVCLASIAFVTEAKALISSHDCADCHSVMGASGSTLLNDASVEVLCMSCHVMAIGSVTAAEVHTNDPDDNSPDYPAFRISCIECHDPHDNQGNYLGGVNIKLVLPSIETPSSGTFSIAFESRGTNNAGEPALNSFADGDSTYDGICEACHTATNHHLNNSAGDHSHHAGETCTRCHSHADAFNQ